MSVIVRRTRSALAQQVVSAVLMVATAIVTARWMGPTEKGHLSLLMAWAFFASVVFGMGVPQALTTWVSRDGISPGRSLLVAYVLAATSILLSLAVSFVLWRSSVTSLELVAALLPLATGLMVLTASITAIGIGLGELRIVIVNTLVPSGVALGIFVGAWGLGYPGAFRTAALGWLLAMPVGTTWASVLVLRHPAAAAAKSARVSYRSMLGFGFKSTPAQLFSAFNLRLDVVVLGLLSTSRQVGLYSVATSATALGLILPSAIGQALARSFGQQEMERDAVSRAVRVVLVSSVVSSVALAVVAVPLVRLLFGTAFGPSALMIALILPGTAVYGVVPLVLQYAYNWSHSPRAAAVITFCTLLSGTALLIVLGHRLGGAGASIASGVSYLIGAVVALEYMRTWLGVSRRELLLVRRDDVTWLVAKLPTFFGTDSAGGEVNADDTSIDEPRA